jgi:hypothetical protein
MGGPGNDVTGQQCRNQGLMLGAMELGPNESTELGRTQGDEVDQARRARLSMSSIPFWGD